MKLREIARACRSMAVRYADDAAAMGESLQAEGKRREEKKFTDYANELEQLAKERE